MLLWRICQSFFLLGATLVACKIADYEGVFDPWARLYDGMYEVYTGEENTDEVANADEVGAVVPTQQANGSTQQPQQPNSPQQPIIQQPSIVTVSAGVTSTPALDALLDEMNAQQGEI